MASTYSTNLAIELIGTGEQSGTWGTTTNTNLGTLLEQAISGYVTQPITDGSGANTTITIPNGTTGVARNMFIEMTGALSFATTSLIVPANKKLYFIFNNTSGGFAVTVKVSGQTGILVPNGKKVVLVSNGTDIVEAHTAIVGNATVGGTLGVGGALSVTASAASQFRNDQNTETYIFIRNDSAGTAATARLDLITGTGADRALTLVNYGSGYTGTFAGVALANLRVIYDNAAGAASNGIMIASPKTIYIAPNNSVVGTFAAAGLTVTGTLGAGATSVTTLAASGVVSTTARSMLVQPTTATNDGSYKVTNSGGTLFVGLDDSAAGAFGTAGNYGTVIYRPNGTGLAISRTSTVDLAISSAGVVNIPGGLNNTVLGATTPAAASVTTLAASGNITATTGAGTFGSLVLANSGSELWRAGASAASRAWSLRNDVSAFGDFLLQHSSTNNDTINTTLVSFSTGAVAVTGTLGVTGNGAFGAATDANFRLYSVGSDNTGSNYGLVVRSANLTDTLLVRNDGAVIISGNFLPPKMLSSFTVTAWNPSDVIGTATAPSTLATNDDSAYTTVAISAGVITMTFDVAGTYLVTINGASTNAISYTYARETIVLSGTATRRQAGTAIQFASAGGVYSFDHTYGTSFLVSATAAQTLILTTTFELSGAGTTAQHTCYLTGTALFTGT